MKWGLGLGVRCLKRSFQTRCCAMIFILIFLHLLAYKHNSYQKHSNISLHPVPASILQKQQTSAPVYVNRRPLHSRSRSGRHRPPRPSLSSSFPPAIAQTPPPPPDLGQQAPLPAPPPTPRHRNGLLDRHHARASPARRRARAHVAAQAHLGHHGAGRLRQDVGRRVPAFHLLAALPRGRHGTHSPAPLPSHPPRQYAKRSLSLSAYLTGLLVVHQKDTNKDKRR